MRDFKKLVIWQKAIDLSELVYKISSEFPEDEKYGLVSQIRRCAISIPSNIAEGAGRSTDKEKSRFMDISIGSSHELETQLILAERLKFLPHFDFNGIFNAIDELQKMMYKFRLKLKE